MKKISWLVVSVFILMAGCAQTANNGLTPTEPSYSGTYPSTLVLFDGSFAASCGLTLYLPPPYTAAVSISAGDTSVPPIIGNSNLFFSVSNFNPGGNASSPTGYWASLAIIPFGSSGGATFDISSGGYTNASFYYRISMPSAQDTQIIGFSVPGASRNVTVSSPSTSWVPMTIPLSFGNLHAVSNFFTIGLGNTTAAAPVSIYIDDLVYH
jgi:hypothetical protein